MSKSENIRSMAGSGSSVADIARQVGVSYQHAYNVLKAAGSLPTAGSNVAPRTPTPGGGKSAKPPLLLDVLTAGGFVHAGRWILGDQGALVLDRPLTKDAGVYALVKDEVALYVGLATMGLAKRLYFYGRPGSTQRTSQRVNGLLKAELSTLPHIDIYVATPPDLTWNGLPISGNAGLELGLIEGFSLPWNIRGARKRDGIVEVAVIAANPIQTDE